MRYCWYIKINVANQQAVSWPTPGSKHRRGSNNSHATSGHRGHLWGTSIQSWGYLQNPSIYGWIFHDDPSICWGYIPPLMETPINRRCIVPLATSSKLAHWIIPNSPYQAEHQRNWNDVEQRFDTTAMVWLPCPIWSEHRLQIGVSVHTQ